MVIALYATIRNVVSSRPAWWCLDCSAPNFQYVLAYINAWVSFLPSVVPTSRFFFFFLFFIFDMCLMTGVFYNLKVFQFSPVSSE